MKKKRGPPSPQPFVRLKGDSVVFVIPQKSGEPETINVPLKNALAKLKDLCANDSVMKQASQRLKLELAAKIGGWAAKPKGDMRLADAPLFRAVKGKTQPVMVLPAYVVRDGKEFFTADGRAFILVQYHGPGQVSAYDYQEVTPAGPVPEDFHLPERASEDREQGAEPGDGKVVKLATKTSRR